MPRSDQAGACIVPCTGLPPIPSTPFPSHYFVVLSTTNIKRHGKIIGLVVKYVRFIGILITVAFRRFSLVNAGFLCREVALLAKGIKETLCIFPFT
jgi:hypothetical protein